MNRRETIINEQEKIFGIECDVNEDFDVLCDGDTCRHSECDCWDDLRRDVESHLEGKKEKQRLRGSMTAWDLSELLRNASGSVDNPVFVNGEPIYEAWSDGESFHITTRDSYTAEHPDTTLSNILGFDVNTLPDPLAEVQR